MSSTDIYNNVGPFRGVPDTLTKRIANIANSAAETVMAAAVREARTKSDASGDERVFLQGPDVINRLDDRYLEEQRWQRSHAYGDITFASLISVGILSFFIAWLLHAPEEIEPWGIAAAAVIVLFSVFMIGVMVRSTIFPAIKRLRELRSQGYVADHLPETVRSNAGKCWLLGEQAIEIAELGGKDGAFVTSVFYDAIGTVAITTDKGIESVALLSRSGGWLATLSSPVCVGSACGSAHQLAEAIRTEMANCGRYPR
jgi:hypothetical protein